MRRPSSLNHIAIRHQEQGFALFMVLMIMMVVALLIIAASQAYNTEQRISSNDADRKLAFSLADAALRAGESKILSFDASKTNTFSNNCTNGLCAAVGASSSNSDIVVTGNPTIPAWKRTCGEQLCIDVNGISYNTDTTKSGVSQNARYIIEYVNTENNTGAIIYRVTAKAWGKNINTVVMLQSYVSKD